MKISTPAELGAYIRDRRKARGLSQDDLAKLVPASQKWVSEVENGKTTAEIGQVMRLLSVLGVSIDLGAEDAKSGAVARHRKAIQRSFVVRKREHDSQGQKGLSSDTFASRTLVGRKVKAGSFYPTSNGEKDGGETPAVRFHRAVTKNNNQSLEEQSARLRDAFKRWGFK